MKLTRQKTVEHASFRFLREPTQDAVWFYRMGHKMVLDTDLPENPGPWDRGCAQWITDPARIIEAALMRF